MFGLGLPEAIILGVIILLLFGRRLPAMFRSLGESLPAFKDGLAEEKPGSQNPPGNVKHQSS